MENQPQKTVDTSVVEMVEVVLPNDTNPLGNILGGKVMHLMDMAGAIAAHRYSRSIVVTASIDSLDFLHPIRVGQLVILKAMITAAFGTSMEVKVEVFSEDILTGERRPTSTAFLTFVAIDKNGKPIQVPKLVLKTDEEKRRYNEALQRREDRLKRRTKAD